MEWIVPLLVMFSADCVIQSLPIYNGFTVKFNPLSAKEDVKPKTFGALFAKIPQETTIEATQRKEILSKAYYPPSPELGAGYSNQIAKIIFPLINNGENYTHTWHGVNIINLPIIKQPLGDYKILVAAAPPNMKIGGEDQPVVIYIVFPENGTSDPNFTHIPSIYFVNKQNGKIDIDKKEKMDPILIIDSNRTVTGLKSKEVAKHVKFRNKLINRLGR